MGGADGGLALQSGDAAFGFGEFGGIGIEASQDLSAFAADLHEACVFGVDLRGELEFAGAEGGFVGEACGVEDADLIACGVALKREGLSPVAGVADDDGFAGLVEPVGVALPEEAVAEDEEFGAVTKIEAEVVGDELGE